MVTSSAIINWVILNRQRLLIYLACLLVLGSGLSVLFASNTAQILKHKQAEIAIKKDQLKNTLLAQADELTAKANNLKTLGLLADDLLSRIEEAKTLIAQNRLTEAQKILEETREEISKWEEIASPPATTPTPPKNSPTVAELIVKVNDENRPVSQATITLYQAKKIIAQTATSEMGLASLKVPPGTYGLQAKKSGYSNLWQNITLSSNKPLELTLSLKKISGGGTGSTDSGKDKTGGSSGNNQGAPTPTPSPTKPPPRGGLTKEGIFYWTNNARSNNNISALQAHSLLDQAAANKVADFFACNYYAHNRPASDRCPAKNWVDFVNEVGYRYQMLGENIAFVCCNYTDQQVVDLWMGSSGHRRNILNSVFIHLGVGIGYGTINNQAGWAAVQIFGTPF